MIYKGKKKCILYHGDNHPASLYIGDKKISGYKLETITGKGQISWASQYKANLPSVIVKGVGEQKKLKGYNLLDIACIKATSAKPYGMTVTLVNGRFRIYGKSTITMKAFFTIAYAIDSRYSGKGYTLYTRNWEGSKFDHKKIYGLRTETDTSIAIGVDLTEGVDYDFSFNILMTKGDGSALPYEPYCGGIPAPNSEYPIEPKFLTNATLTDGIATATIPILRALPDGSVRDEYDVVSGKLTRRIREYIYTGEEDDLGVFQVPGLCILYKNVHDAKINNNTKNACSNQYTPGTYLSRKDGECYTVNGRFDIYNMSFYVADDASGSPQSKKLWIQHLREQYAAGNPVKVWYALQTPIIEQYDPTVICQHPGYTQLIQQGGFTQTDISATAYIKETK